MQNVLMTKTPNQIPNESTVENCIPDDPLTTCIMSNDVAHTKIRVDPVKSVIEISREVDDPDGQIRDCYQLVGEWFGGPEFRRQHWPIQGMYFEEEPYVTSHPEDMAIVERYWLSSKGVYLYVSMEDPLFVDQNNEMDKHLCFIARNKAPYQKRDKVQYQDKLKFLCL